MQDDPIHHPLHKPIPPAQSGTPDIDHHPDHRAIQLAAAQATLSEIDRRSDADVAQACRVILALSRDHTDRTRAQDLLLVLKGV
jgi:hypothetical protein